MRITQLLALALKLNHHYVQNGTYLVAFGRGKLDYHVDEYAAGYLPTAGNSGSNQVIQSISSLSNVWNESRGAVLWQLSAWIMPSSLGNEAPNRANLHDDGLLRRAGGFRVFPGLFKSWVLLELWDIRVRVLVARVPQLVNISDYIRSQLQGKVPSFW